MYICSVWVQNFVWNFKGHLWNFTQKSIHHTPKICILLPFCVISNIVDLWRHKPRSVPWSMQSYYMNHCYYNVKWTLGNIFQWNLNRNSNMSVMLAILSRSQYADIFRPGHNCRYFACDALKCIFLNKTHCKLFMISMEYIPHSSISKEKS